MEAALSAAVIPGLAKAFCRTGAPGIWATRTSLSNAGTPAKKIVIKAFRERMIPFLG